MILPGRKLGFNDVMIEPRSSSISSRKEVNLLRSFPVIGQCFPIIASNMDTIGTFSMAKVLSKYKIITCIHKYYTHKDWEIYLNENNASHTAFTMGLHDSYLEELYNLKTKWPSLNIICLDVANGYQEKFLEFTKKVKTTFPGAFVIAGNIATTHGAQALRRYGAEAVKVGIGSGSACTTRKKTGVGYPQVSAIHEISGFFDDCHFNNFVVSDGGCTSTGDIAKAFVAGADFVMLGGMLAGHDECEGEFEEQIVSVPSCIDAFGNSRAGYETRKFMKFYGMASRTSMNIHHGDPDYRVAEGKTVSVPYKGPVENTIKEIAGGLQSCGSYIGARTIEEFSRANLIEVKEQLNNIFGE